MLFACQQVRQKYRHTLRIFNTVGECASMWRQTCVPFVALNITCIIRSQFSISEITH